MAVGNMNIMCILAPHWALSQAQEQNGVPKLSEGSLESSHKIKKLIKTYV